MIKGQANRIESLKRKKHLSYGQIGQVSGLSAAYVYLLAKNKRTNPSLTVMQNISNALGENVEKVFNINSKKEAC